MHRVTEGSEQRRLAEAGHAFQQDVAARDQRDQHAFDHVVMADNDFADLVTDLPDLPGDYLQKLFRLDHQFFSCSASKYFWMKWR